MAKLTEIEKKISQIAGDDWNNQCRRFMSGHIPFRDKTAKACYLRHEKEYKERADNV